MSGQVDGRLASQAQCRDAQDSSSLSLSRGLQFVPVPEPTGWDGRQLERERELDLVWGRTAKNLKVMSRLGKVNVDSVCSKSFVFVWN